MPHPDTDIIPLPFFMWFCHHLTNIHGLESGTLFFFFIYFLNREVRQTLSQIPNKITFHKKNVLTLRATVESSNSGGLQSCGVRSAVVWANSSLLTEGVSQNVMNGPGSDN